jgi:ADP-dependent NAD(P)H-hydrate dehydratase
MLAAIASLRVGAGKLQVATSKDAALALAIAIPEAKVSGLQATIRGGIAKLDSDVARAAEHADAVLVGPGMDPTAATKKIATAIMRRAKAVVLDAGALATPMTGPRQGTMILTPHWGEMAGWLGVGDDDVAKDPTAAARAMAESSNATVVLKGPDTVIANAQGAVWIHKGSCAGLGTSGSGDVLAGLICGLLALGADPDQASVWGVALHARAGEILTQRFGQTGFLSREIAAEVPAIKEAWRLGGSYVN